MKTTEVLQKIHGIQTIGSVMKILEVTKKKAIYYITRLRREGYVRTKAIEDKTRVYNISSANKFKGKSYYDIINENSPIQISSRNVHYIYGKELTIEEALIFAVRSKSLRLILASLALFGKVKDWPLLHKAAKQNQVERQIGALYDLARKTLKTRKMPKRFRNNCLPKKAYPFEYTIEGLRSKDFKEIESTWRIYLPFNKKDLEEYK